MGRRSHEAQQWQRWYKTKLWQRLRANHLKAHPYCQCPHHKGKHAVANTVDHKAPHRGDRRLFFDARNLQSMTKQCHDRYKQSQEKGGVGFNKGCDVRGWPLSQEHDWYSI